ncbi:MAG: MjaI family restriction endonuclease, partial [Bacteroidetes bacterium]|nr:MjaI family restriction endonuclease [Bacteroidota bacterium]
MAELPVTACDFWFCILGPQSRHRTELAIYSMPDARTEVKLPVKEMYARAGAQPPDFPKYTTQLMNLANQNAQGTRPAVVGQMSKLVREADPASFREWKQWYEERHPDALERATERIADHVEKLKQAIKAIDRDMIRD